MSFYSTTAISKKYGLKARPLVFDFLYNNNYIYKSSVKPYQRLTDLGVAIGGIYNNPQEKSWIVWNETQIAPLLQEIKNEIINKNPFRLYHITHIDNLLSILQSGEILPHNRINKYTDISNQRVNERRSKEEPCFGHKIHDYVPLYFNPRNAMLYVVQNNYPEDIILLEVDNKICLRPQTIFSYKNAAADDAEFFYDIQVFLSNVDWSMINSRTWCDNYIIKKVMMSECLIYNTLPIHYISNIYCKKQITADKVCSIFGNSNYLPHIETIYYNSNLFF